MQKLEKIEPILRELLENDPLALNEALADEVSTRTGILISKQEISRIRNKIGLGAWQLAEQTHRQEMEKEFPNLALILAVNCVRNTVIEAYHAGRSPHSITGDYTDVYVETPNGRIPWNELSRINDDEMMAFNMEVANKIYTALVFIFGNKSQVERKIFLEMLSRMYPRNWNKPQLDTSFMAAMDLRISGDRTDEDA